MLVKLNRLNLFLLSLVFISTAMAAPPAYPKFNLKSIDGALYNTQSLRGKAIFLSFFSETCKPCREEVPFLNDLQKKYPDTLKIVAVGFMEDNPDKLKALGKSWGVQYTICVDAGEIAIKAFEVSALPRGFLLDDSGKLVASYVGMTEKNKRDLLNRLKELDREISARSSTPRAYYVNPSFKIDGGDAAMARRWSARVADVIEQKGGRLVASASSADYIVNGDILALGPDISIDITISDRQGNGLDNFAVSVTESDYAMLGIVLEARMKRLR